MSDAGKKLIKSMKEVMKVSQCDHDSAKQDGNKLHCPKCGVVMHLPPK